jgi:glycerol-3-phosphate dehydrogenase subunit B
LKVLVVGAGAAGTAAAWSLSRAGAELTVVHAKAGATSLYSGALDLIAPEPNREHPPLAPEVVAFAAALGGWTLRPGGCRIATRAGVARWASGMDGALLDLTPLAGRSVAVADVERDDWDAALIARALSASEWARSTRTQFSALRVAALKTGAERRTPPFDFAQLHDAPDRGDFLVEKLQRASAAHDAWLVGPWLGVVPETAERLRERLHMPLGESTSPPGGAAGARFDHARDRLLENLGIAVQRESVVSIAAHDDGWHVEFAGRQKLLADAVVLAVGGMVSGGVRLLNGVASRTAFKLSLEAPVRFELDGHDLDAPSTLHGIDFQAHGLAALQRIGIATDGVRVQGQAKLFAAGDVVSARPRTVLEAIRAGLAAARAALD